MRILAPLLVLTLFGIIAIRWTADPVQERERAWIEGSWDLATQRADVKERLTARLEGQLERYGDDAEIRWFAARAWLKVGEVGRAIDAIWGVPALADAPGTARRFGALVLRVLGFLDDQHLRQPRAGAAMAALILAEGGDEQAAAWLDETIRVRLQGGFWSSLYGTFLYGTRDGSLRVADALRARGEPIADVIAALTAMAPTPYPDRDADLVQLEEIVLRDADRTRQRSVWTAACVALGSSEDARALHVLDDLHTRLARSADDAVRADAAVAAAGLLAGGRWSELEALRPYFARQRRLPHARLWIFSAIQARLARGDPEAAEAWLEAWRSFLIQPDVRLAERVATSLLLGHSRPPSAFPVDLVLEALERPEAPLPMHAIAGASRYRAGDTAGRDALLQVLRQLEEAGWPGDDLLVLDPLWISPVLTACRALVLYDPAPRP